MRFPVDGTATEVGRWLQTKDFDTSIIENFAKWDAETMLCVSEAVAMRRVPGDEGERLWSALCAAKKPQC